MKKMDNLKSFRFWENWYEMAEARDTDEKRLAFYDAIFRYAFDGMVPGKPVRGESPGSAWAAWDAYLLTKNIIEGEAKKRTAGAKGGSAKGASKARYGNRNASKTQAKRKQDASKTQARLFIKDERLKIKEEDEVSSSPPTPPKGEEMETKRGFHPPTESEVVAFAADDTRHAVGKIDEAWVREWYAAMARLDPPWADSRGRTIVSWQRRLVSDWRMERRRREGGGGNGGKPAGARGAGNGAKGGGYVDPNYKPMKTIRI